MDNKILNALEFNKIMEQVAKFAVINESKRRLLSMNIQADFHMANLSLSKTIEAMALLYDYGVGNIEHFDDANEILARAKKGSTLSMAELLNVARVLKSGRVLAQSILNVENDNILLLKEIASQIYTDDYLENDITSKILADDKMSDNASNKLKETRKLIKKLNDQIRDTLNSYIRNASSYLQDSIITMRADRYVIPVKSQYRGQVRGLVHDRSTSGSTLFIEPEAVLTLNNQLKMSLIEEQQEIDRILAELSNAVGMIASMLEKNVERVVEVDEVYAKAIYAYRTKSVKPELNSKGIIQIKQGRHPLIDSKKVIPISISLGEKYNYCLVTGPNTGGKTVTLKMVGLFSLMAMNGMYVPASSAKCSVFENIFCDIGDEQSIEQSLSTFSSHMTNIINITNNINSKSLVLLDEIGAGTDPDEGSALAQAVIEHLLNKGSFGIITTHYTSLKEYAYTKQGIINASMDFDAKTFAPLYKINIGVPGSSNAIEIARQLGLSEDLSNSAVSLLSDNKISFENVIREAEKSRQECHDIKIEIQTLKDKAKEELDKINKEREKFEKEKQKFLAEAKATSKRIVNDRLEEAESLVEEIRIMFDKAELDSGDLIRARTLKNKLEDSKYSLEESATEIVNYSDVDINKLKVNDKVYYKKMQANCTVANINAKKREVEVYLGSVKIKVKAGDLSFISEMQAEVKSTIALKREGVVETPTTRLNIIGQNVMDAMPEVQRFLDKAVLNNLQKVEIVHGKGLRILSTEVHKLLKRDKRVESYRFGKYGEGEHGVTIVNFK